MVCVTGIPSENRLRPLTQIADAARQLEEFRKLLAQAPL